MRPEIFQQLQTVRAEVDTLSRLILDAGEEAAPQVTPPQGSPERAYLSVRDVAERYHVTPATIYRWAREGRFPGGSYWGPRTRRWSAAELEGANPNGHQS